MRPPLAECIERALKQLLATTHPNLLLDHHGTANVIARAIAKHERTDDDAGPYDPDELVQWADLYGHPEGWAKRAQAAHARAEKLAARVDALERGLRQVGEHPSLAVQIAAEVLGEPLVLDPLSPTAPPAREDLGTL